jgi:hypothetical protein
MRTASILTALLFAILAGCDDPTDDDTVADDDDSTGEPGLAPCTFADAPVARFAVTQRGADEWSVSVTGEVWEEPYPSWHQVLRESENCRYMVYLPGSCDPPCAGGELCTADSECVGWPTGVAAGTMTVEGLGDPLVIEPLDHAPGSYYTSLTLPLDQFGELAPISVSLSGDIFPAVELAARGVSQVVADAAADGLPIPDAEPVTVSWNAGQDPGACAEVHLYTQNMGHGLPIINVMECIGPDIGSLTIPAEMTDIWPDWTTPGVCAGIDCPYSEVVRHTRQIVPTDAGDAWLTASSRSQFKLLGE